MASRFDLERTKAKMDGLRRGGSGHSQKTAEARDVAKGEYLRKQRERREFAALVAQALGDGRLGAELDKLGYDLVERPEDENH